MDEIRTIYAEKEKVNHELLKAKKELSSIDIEKMEKLGIYEVLPEDFALAEVACTSKLPLQQIVRNGLNDLRKEMM